MSRKRVFFAWNYLNWGGAQIYFLSIIKLIRSDWEVVVVLPAGSSPEFISFLDDLNVSYVFFERSLDKREQNSIGGKLLRQFRRLRAELSMYKALANLDIKDSIVHIDSPPWQSTLLLTALIAKRSHVFITLHNFVTSSNPLRRGLWKIRIRFLTLLPRFNIFTSNIDSKKRFRKYFGEDFSKKIAVTYTAVDPEQISKVLSSSRRKEIRSELGISDASKVILSVGQFVDRKGRWDVLNAATSVLKESPDSVFIWLMPEPMDEMTTSQVNKYGLGNSFRPILSRSVGSNRLDILSFFTIADIFVLPSYIEGLPIALLEAMALGIPSVSTRVYGIPEGIIDDVTGILIDPGSPDQLADAILRLSREKNFRDNVAAKGREHVLTNFDETKVAEIVRTAYERSLGIN